MSRSISFHHTNFTFLFVTLVSHSILCNYFEPTDTSLSSIVGHRSLVLISDLLIPSIIRYLVKCIFDPHISLIAILFWFWILAQSAKEKKGISKKERKEKNLKRKRYKSYINISAKDTHRKTSIFGSSRVVVK